MNPFYKSFKQNQNSNFNELPKTLPELVNFLMLRGQTPEQKVRELVSSGKMSPELFERYSQMASQVIKNGHS